MTLYNLHRIRLKKNLFIKEIQGRTIISIKFNKYNLAFDYVAFDFLIISSSRCFFYYFICNCHWCAFGIASANISLTFSFGNENVKKF